MKKIPEEHRQLTITVENLEQCLVITKACTERNIKCTTVIDHTYTGGRTLVIYVTENKVLCVTSLLPPYKNARTFNTFSLDELDKIIMEHYL